MLLAIVLLFGLVRAMGYGEGTSLPAAAIGAAVSIAAVAVGDMNSLVGMGQASMEQMQGFSKVLLPSVAAATTATGYPAAATAKLLATMLFSDFLITLIHRLLLPLTFAYIAASVGYAALGNAGLRRIGGLLKWIIHTVLTVVLLAFVGYLSISGAISGSADEVTVKAAKFTVSSLVPVVGGILSDAAETILVGASLLRSAIGVFGMLTVVGICLIPFLNLGAHYLAYKVTAALASTVADDKTAGLIDDIGGAFGLILGMTGACGLLLLIAMVSAISMSAG